MSDTRFVEIYRAENGVAAHLVKGELEAAGIAAQVTDESFSALRGPNIWWASPRILVAEVDAAKAAAIIRDLETARAARSASDDAD
jgi:parvulin-like peptidyl-prolyl isomerase